MLIRVLTGIFKSGVPQRDTVWDKQESHYTILLIAEKLEYQLKKRSLGVLVWSRWEPCFY